MPRLRYSIKSQLDIERFFTFLRQKDRQAALRAVSTIRESLLLLQQMPQIGRPVEDGLRELIIDFGNSGYVALYDFDRLSDEVVIYAIKHQFEDDY